MHQLSANRSRHNKLCYTQNDHHLVVLVVVFVLKVLQTAGWEERKRREGGRGRDGEGEGGMGREGGRVDQGR